MKLTTRDMKNPNMTNEEAIAIIEANYPSERYFALRDSMILAVKALMMTSKTFRKERHNDQRAAGTSDESIRPE